MTVSCNYYPELAHKPNQILTIIFFDCQASIVNNCGRDQIYSSTFVLIFGRTTQNCGGQQTF